MIGGSVRVESTPGEGTTFTLELNDPDALEKVLLIEVAGQKFGVQTSHVEEVLFVREGEIEQESDSPASGLLQTEGGTIPVAILRHMLGDSEVVSTSSAGADGQDEILLVCRGTSSRIGLLIDDLLDERLLNVRALNPLLRSFSMFDGSLLDQGRQVVLVINPTAII